MKLTLLSFSVLVAIAGCATSSEDATSGDESDVTALSTAFSQSCTLAKLEDDGVFEESLSKEEYPDVSVERDGKTGEVTVSIGDSVYSSKGNDATVALATKSATHAEASIVMKAGIRYVVKLDATTGTISTSNGSAPERLVADLACTPAKQGDPSSLAGTWTDDWEPTTAMSR